MTPTPLGATATRHLMPTFAPSPAAAHGLDMLAAAATATTDAPVLPPASDCISNPGLFNPAASLPPKVTRRILDLEMSEVTVDDDLPQTPGRQPAPACLPVTDISQWLERYSLMAALLATRFPDKAPELFSYQATIVRAERNYEGKRWVTYDRQFRREALARKDLNWSVTNPRLYNEAFTGRARAIPRCSFCLQDDHRAADCPRDPNRPVFGWFPGMSPWPVHSVAPQLLPPQQASDRAPHAEICRRYNDGKCKQQHCKYRHACSGCCGPHMLLECPQPGRDRSPRRSAFRGGAPP